MYVDRESIFQALALWVSKSDISLHSQELLTLDYWTVYFSSNFSNKPKIMIKCDHVLYSIKLNELMISIIFPAF